MLKDRTITTYQDNVKVLSDTPSSDGVTAEQLKAMFDGRTDKEVKTSINGIIDDLTAAADGASGADNVGATPLKEGGAETVQGQLEELYNEKSSKLDLASSADGNSGADNIGSTALKSGGSTTVQGQLEELEADKVDKIAGKGLSANDFTDTYKTKLDGIEENANHYVLPVPTATQIGGVKAGVSIEIEADGTINGLAAPAPDLVARANIAQEVIDRQDADQVLTNRIATEETTRSTADVNLQAQITANKNAVNVNISEAVRTLYGLTTDNANVDKALQRAVNTRVKAFTSNGDFVIPPGFTKAIIYACAAGSATGQAGACELGNTTYSITPGSTVSVTVGMGNTLISGGGISLTLVAGSLSKSLGINIFGAITGVSGTANGRGHIKGFGGAFGFAGGTGGYGSSNNAGGNGAMAFGTGAGERSPYSFEFLGYNLKDILPNLFTSGGNGGAGQTGIGQDSGSGNAGGSPSGSNGGGGGGGGYGAGAGSNDDGLPSGTPAPGMALIILINEDGR